MRDSASSWREGVSIAMDLFFLGRGMVSVVEGGDVQKRDLRGVRKRSEKLAVLFGVNLRPRRRRRPEVAVFFGASWDEFWRERDGDARRQEEERLRENTITNTNHSLKNTRDTPLFTTLTSTSYTIHELLLEPRITPPEPNLPQSSSTPVV